MLIQDGLGGKNFNNLLKWLVEDKQRMYVFFSGLCGMKVDVSDKKRGWFPLMITPESYNDVLPEIDPKEHRFRKTCETLMSMLYGVRNTVALISGKSADNIFNEALESSGLDVKTSGFDIVVHLPKTKEEEQLKKFKERNEAKV